MGALLITWSESVRGWPHEKIAELAQAFERDGVVEQDWRVHAYRKAKVGDRVWLLRQGAGQRVIFGVGEIVQEPRAESDTDGIRGWTRVRFHRFTDPRVAFLIPEADVRAILRNSQISTQASGVQISDEQDAALDARLALPDWNHLAVARMVDAFKRNFPGFVSFKSGAEEYERAERRYKLELARRFNETVVPKLADPAALADAYIDVLLAQDVNRERQNLIDQRWACQRLKAWDAEQRRVFGALLADVLAADAAARGAALDRMVDGARPLLAAVNVSGPAEIARQLATLPLMLIDPVAVLFARRTHLERAYASLKGRPIPRDLAASELQAEADAFAAGLMEILHRERLDPADMIDVQSMLFVTYDTPMPATTEEAEAVMHPLNLILYGPPGTGKTFATAQIAVEICDGRKTSADRADVMARYTELVATGRIAFITFHQSFAYEDFVEGLRPEVGDGETGGGFRLEVRDGVLKTMAARARASGGRVADATPKPLEGRAPYKMSLGRANEPDGVLVFEECMREGYVLLGYGGEIDWSPEEYGQQRAILQRWRKENSEADGADANVKTINMLRNSIRDGDLIIVSDGNPRFRAIGEVTGPYRYLGEREGYRHSRPVRWLWRGTESLPVEMIYAKQFVQGSLYGLGSSETNWAALTELVGMASGPEDSQPHVLIIDEINRGNVSKTFGELITLLEPDKRTGEINALSARLPYSGADFELPANLHILGTMNTADRSIALLDSALRRRFAFEELRPQPELLPRDVGSVDVRRALEGINDRLEYLFDRDHLIGHAYFLGAESVADLSEVMLNKIAPLLAEYFHEDWEKVRAVLGETRDDGAFVCRRALPIPKGLAEAAYDVEVRYRYEIAPGPHTADDFAQLYP